MKAHHGGTIHNTGQTTNELGIRNSSARVLPQGTVCLSRTASVGYVVTMGRPMATSQDFVNWICSDKLDRRFLAHLLIAEGTTLLRFASGATHQTIYYPEVKAFHVCLPPLPEQERIVAILDEAFEGIGRAAANAEKNLANARELFESYLNAIFTQKGEGWVEQSLSDLVEIKHGFAFKSEYFASEGEHVLLTPGNFFEEGGYRNRGGKQKHYVGEIPRGYILNKGDFLIAMTEQAAGLLGSSLIVPEHDKFLHNQRLGLVCPHDGIPWCNEFFSHAFNTKSFRQVVHDGASGVKVRHTSPKKLGRVLVAYPSSIAEQDRIARLLDNVLSESERLQECYQQKLDALSELKQSILEKALSGELTARPDQAPQEAVA